MTNSLNPTTLPAPHSLPHAPLNLSTTLPLSSSRVAAISPPPQPLPDPYVPLPDPYVTYPLARLLSLAVSVLLARSDRLSPSLALSLPPSLPPSPPPSLPLSVSLCPLRLPPSLNPSPALPPSPTLRPSHAHTCSSRIVWSRIEFEVTGSKQGLPYPYNSSAPGVSALAHV